jgi:hypothetical protein
MGIEYKVIVQDDFNWEYIGKTKSNILNELCDEIEKLERARPIIMFEWYGYALLDFHKTTPNLKEYGNLILKYCDSAHFIADDREWEIIKIDKDKLY